tara:strand:- start:20 stop:760 length:741 start_codon:yes stop_codon:yes gene_type:complete
MNAQNPNTNTAAAAAKRASNLQNLMNSVNKKSNATALFYNLFILLSGFFALSVYVVSVQLKKKDTGFLVFGKVNKNFIKFLSSFRYAILALTLAVFLIFLPNRKYFTAKQQRSAFSSRLIVQALINMFTLTVSFVNIGIYDANPSSYKQDDLWFASESLTNVGVIAVMINSVLAGWQMYDLFKATPMLARSGYQHMSKVSGKTIRKAGRNFAGSAFEAPSNSYTNRSRAPPQLQPAPPQPQPVQPA